MLKIQRLTKQRKAILDYLQSVKTHPNADKIHSEVIKTIPNISLGTIYRNLQILVDNKQIIKLEIGGEFRYDACVKSHQHLICKICSRIIDTHDKKIEEFVLKQTRNKEFFPETTTVFVSGICLDCKRKLKSTKKH